VPRKREVSRAAAMRTSYKIVVVATFEKSLSTPDES
jgi:hypothetical protein